MEITCIGDLQLLVTLISYPFNAVRKNADFIDLSPHGLQRQVTVQRSLKGLKFKRLRLSRVYFSFSFHFHFYHEVLFSKGPC